MENQILSAKTETPVRVSKITSGPDKILSKSKLYQVKKEGKIKFHYLGSVAFIFISELNAVLTSEPTR